LPVLFASVGSGGQRIITEAYVAFDNLRTGNYFLCINTSASDHDRMMERFRQANVKPANNIMTLVVGEGFGAGKDPELGLKAYNSDKAKVVDTLKELHNRMNFKIAFVLGSLGGGCGSLVLPEVARDIRTNLGIRVIPMVTLPFRREGELLINNAVRGLRKLSEYGFNPLVYDNEKTLEYARTVNEAIRMANRCFSILISSLIDVVEYEDFAVPPVDIIDVTRIIMPQCGAFSTVFYDNAKDFMDRWRKELERNMSLRSKILTVGKAFVLCKARHFPQKVAEDVMGFLRSKFKVTEIIPSVMEGDFVGYTIMAMIWGFGIDSIRPRLEAKGRSFLGLGRRAGGARRGS